MSYQSYVIRCEKQEVYIHYCFLLITFTNQGSAPKHTYENECDLLLSKCGCGMHGCNPKLIHQRINPTELRITIAACGNSMHIHGTDFHCLQGNLKLSN